MHPSELNPKPYCSSAEARQVYATQGRRKGSLLRKAVFFGLLAVGAYNIHSCVSDVVGEAAAPAASRKIEDNKSVHIRIPKNCVPYFREMKKMNVSRDLRILTAKTVYIESKFNQKAKGSAGDVGYGQLTKVNIEDTIERAFDTPLSDGGRLVSSYLKAIPFRDRINYSGRWLNSYFTRRRIVNKVYDLVKKDGRANLRFTGATLSFGKRQVGDLCNKLHIPCTPDMVDAHHNAPKRTIDSIKKKGKNWKASPILPKITANRNKRFNRLVLLN